MMLIKLDIGGHRDIGHHDCHHHNMVLGGVRYLGSGPGGCWSMMISSLIMTSIHPNMVMTMMMLVVVVDIS